MLLRPAQLETMDVAEQLRSMIPGSMMMKLRRSLVPVLAFVCATNGAAAQDSDRTLHWRALDVAAHLDADGRLRVRERQTMVFNGDWNGGSRTFNVRPGQRLELHSITRIDADGTTHPLRPGSLDDVDRFDWEDGSTVRWRSRRTSDPPFASRELIYELDYTLTRILMPRKGGYLLDHDFAFTDRPGVIEGFSLALDADDAWQSDSLPLRVERANITPGASVVVTVPLTFTGANAPSDVPRSVPLTVRLALALIIIAACAVMRRRFLAHEHARGRFEPLTPLESIDEAWLGAHVFSMPPEVVGAVWDDKTAGPEVAAMLARMVLEGTLASRVEQKERKTILHLELKVTRADLPAQERRLVNALFGSSSMTTDTEEIRKRYEKTGFDPAALISEGIDKQVRAFSPHDAAPVDRRDSIRSTIIAIFVAATGIAMLFLAPEPRLVLTPIGIVVPGFIALLLAGAYRNTVVNTKAKARRMLASLVVAMTVALVIVLGLVEAGTALVIVPFITVPPNMLFLAVATVLLLGIVFLVLRFARTLIAQERLELRRTLAAGRAFLMRELGRPQPAIADEWYPYLLAFGLGPHIDRWFNAFGAAAHDTSMTSGAIIAAGSSGGWTGGGVQFGGGGGFGGGGVGRTWASAATSLSAGVAAPGSDSSSGGGGGGGSSGGGGGGGW